MEKGPRPLTWAAPQQPFGNPALPDGQGDVGPPPT